MGSTVTISIVGGACAHLCPAVRRAAPGGVRPARGRRRWPAHRMSRPRWGEVATGHAGRGGEVFPSPSPAHRAGTAGGPGAGGSPDRPRGAAAGGGAPAARGHEAVPAGRPPVPGLGDRGQPPPPCGPAARVLWAIRGGHAPVRMPRSRAVRSGIRCPDARYSARRSPAGPASGPGGDAPEARLHPRTRGEGAGPLRDPRHAPPPPRPAWEPDWVLRPARRMDAGRRTAGRRARSGARVPAPVWIGGRRDRWADSR